MSAQLPTPPVASNAQNPLQQAIAIREARLEAIQTLFGSLEGCDRYISDSELGDDIKLQFYLRMRKITRHARIWVKRSLNLSELDLGILLSSSEALRAFEERYEICEEPGFPFKGKEA